jgi:hypothetical protein
MFQYLHQLRSLGFRVRTSEEKALVWAGHVIGACLTATRQGVATYSLLKDTSFRNK